MKRRILFVHSEAVQLHVHVSLDGVQLLQALAQLLVALLGRLLLLLPLTQVCAQIWVYLIINNTISQVHYCSVRTFVYVRASCFCAERWRLWNVLAMSLRFCMSARRRCASLGASSWNMPSSWLQISCTSGHDSSLPPPLTLTLRLPSIIQTQKVHIIAY